LRVVRRHRFGACAPAIVLAKLTATALESGVSAEEAVMAEEKVSKRGWIERQKAKRRAQAERTGDTQEKTGERPKGTYDPQDMADQAAQGAIFGGSRRKI
jgi:hypothetical protein